MNLSHTIPGTRNSRIVACLVIRLWPLVPWLLFKLGIIALFRWSNHLTLQFLTFGLFSRFTWLAPSGSRLMLIAAVPACNPLAVASSLNPVLALAKAWSTCWIACAFFICQLIIAVDGLRYFCSKACRKGLVKIL